MPILADYHVHTHFSGDCEERLENIAEQAVRLGLRELCFTDHQDYDYPPCEDALQPVTADTFLFDAEACYREYLQIRERYRDRIALKFGVELGMQPDAHVVAENRRFVRAFPFDFVIASVHVSNRRDPFYPSFYEGRTEEEAMSEVLAATLENIRLFPDFDVLGHLDYIIRYLPSGRQTMDMEPFSDVLDEILKLLISRGQGLDLNTKQLTRGYSEMNPSRQILRRYHALGGRIVTFGSDAHSAGAVGSAFDRAEKLAAECGIREYCTWSVREASFHGV